jgi:hypothetical protein
MQPHSGHSAIWTGREVIVWNGYPDNGAVAWLADVGAAYYPGGKTQGIVDSDPDKWTPLCPEWGGGGGYMSRLGHSAIWTGKTGNPVTENLMIIWGGTTGPPVLFVDGSLYEVNEWTMKRQSDDLRRGDTGLSYRPENVVPVLSESILGKPTPCIESPLPDSIQVSLTGAGSCPLNGVRNITKTAATESAQWYSDSPGNCGGGMGGMPGGGGAGMPGGTGMPGGMGEMGGGGSETWKFTLFCPDSGAGAPFGKFGCKQLLFSATSEKPGMPISNCNSGMLQNNVCQSTPLRIEIKLPELSGGKCLCCGTVDAVLMP